MVLDIKPLSATSKQRFDYAGILPVRMHAKKARAFLLLHCQDYAQGLVRLCQQQLRRLANILNAHSMSDHWQHLQAFLLHELNKFRGVALTCELNKALRIVFAIFPGLIMVSTASPAGASHIKVSRTGTSVKAEVTSSYHGNPPNLMSIR